MKKKILVIGFLTKEKHLVKKQCVLRLEQSYPREGVIFNIVFQIMDTH